MDQDNIVLKGVDMEFSVLMSVYCKENAEHLRQSLTSVIEQTVKPNEIIIIKDGKLKPDLDCVIEEFESLYPRLFKIFSFEENRGLGYALNFGVINSSYEIIARMDSDDICVSDRFEKQLNCLLNNKDVDMVGGIIAEFEHDIKNIISLRDVPINYKDITKYIKKRNPFNHMTVMYRRDAVLKAGNYQHFMFNEDYYLWCRMIFNNSKMINIPEVIVYARTGSEMFKRRGGLRYAIQDIKLQREMFNLKLIGKGELITNCILRVFVRMMPNRIRKIIYLKALR